MDSFPRDAYLARIGLSSAPPPTAAGLRDLHRAQCFAVAFENVEAFLHRPVSLKPEALEEKILSRKRGGYCFELNSFFLAALQAFGFDARACLGRVIMSRPFAGPRTHQASLVTISGQCFLADVGFGGPGLVEPIPFEDGFEAVQHGRKIRLRRDRAEGMFYEDEFEGQWRRIYVLPEERVEPLDLEMGNHFCATYPESIFRNTLFCALPEPEGKVTVWNRSVHIFKGDKKEERILHSLADLRWLFQRLRLPIPESDLSALQNKLPPWEEPKK